MDAIPAVTHAPVGTRRSVMVPIIPAATRPKTKKVQRLRGFAVLQLPIFAANGASRGLRRMRRASVSHRSSETVGRRLMAVAPSADHGDNAELRRRRGRRLALARRRATSGS